MEDTGEQVNTEAKPAVRKSRSSSCVRLKRTPTRNRSASGSRKRRNSMLKRVRISDSKELFLKHAWTFWYDEQPQKGMTHSEYESSVVRIGTFDTIQSFWRYYNNIVDPAVFPAYSNLRMFKANIKPLWEDPANSNGGKWTISVPKGQTGKCWIRVILFVIASQLTHIDDVCGIVLSVRPQKDTIHIWNKSASSEEIVTSITRQLSDLLQTCDLGPSAPYVSHGAKKAKNRRRTQSSSASAGRESHGDGGARGSDAAERTGNAKHQRSPSEDLDLSGEEECFPLEFDDNGLIKPRRSASVSDIPSSLTGAKIRHKKSESVSGSSFNSSQMSVRQHRKSRSDSQQRRCAIPYRAMGSGAKAKALVVQPRKAQSVDSIPSISTAPSTCGECGQSAPPSVAQAAAAPAEEARASALQTRSSAINQKVNSNLENLYNQIYKPKPGFTPLAVPKSPAISRPTSPKLSARDLNGHAALSDLNSLSDAVADPSAAMGGSPWFLLNLLLVVLMIALAFLVYKWASVAEESLVM